MRELDRIVHALRASATRGEAVVLVTVLGVEGSVYRGAGARMVVTANGETTGAVSGGCLEADIVARTPDVILEGRILVAQYDTRASDDAVMGLGLGCQGVIDLLLEPLTGAALDDAIAFYQRLAEYRDSVTVVTLVRAGVDSAHVGTRLVLSDAGDVLEGDRSLLGREHDTVREVVRPATRLVLCGGGTDAIPLARLARQMGWHVTIVDHRPGFATPARFPDADAIVCTNVAHDARALDDRVGIDARTMAVVMAHSATHDRAYLHALLDAHAGYVGVLGPRRRTVELLGVRGAELPASVYSPVGLDLGAETPDEIALSIVAEIAAVSARRQAGMLRGRSGPIHDRAGQPSASPP